MSANQFEGVIIPGSNGKFEYMENPSIDFLIEHASKLGAEAIVICHGQKHLEIHGGPDCNYYYCTSQRKGVHRMLCDPQNWSKETKPVFILGKFHDIPIKNLVSFRAVKSAIWQFFDGRKLLTPYLWKAIEKDDDR